MIYKNIIYNIIFTCGHCLPEQVTFNDKKLSILYTSGSHNKGLE